MTRRYADKSRIRALMAENGWTYTQAREHLEAQPAAGAALGILPAPESWHDGRGDDGCDDCGAHSAELCQCRYLACYECGADYRYQCNCPDPDDDQPDVEEPEYDWRDLEDPYDPEPPAEEDDAEPASGAVYAEAAPW